MYDNVRKENTLIYAHHISYKNIRNFYTLSEPDYYIKKWDDNSSGGRQMDVL